MPPRKSEPPKLSIKDSVELQEFLVENGVAERIAAVAPEILRLIDLCQRDAVNDENSHSVGSVVLGMKKVGDAVRFFRDAGNFKKAEAEKLQKAHADASNKPKR